MRSAGPIGAVIAVGGAFFAAMQVPEFHDRVLGADTSDMEHVVNTLDVALGKSHIARDRLVDVVKSVNRCGRWPDDAAGDVGTVTSDREQGAQLIIKIAPATHDSRAQGLLEDFTQVMSTSESADEAYAAWLKSWNKGYLRVKRAGCHIPRSGILWRTYSDDDKAARATKLLFLRRYAPQAKKYGARTWTWTQI
jgi:hypothetical protein